MTTAVEAAQTIRSDLKRMNLDANVRGYRIRGVETIVIAGNFDKKNRADLWRLGELYGFKVRRDHRFTKTVLFTIGE